MTASAIEIHAGYRAGIIGRTVALHATTYEAIAGFGVAFEAKVAAGMGEFGPRAERACNRIWAAVRDGVIVGSITIDGEDLNTEGRTGLAHLRWFIVQDGLRGGGVGRRLLEAALAFCDAAGFAETQLWTFRGLDAARRLYEAQGFVLREEWLGRQWGAEVLEQRFVRA